MPLAAFGVIGAAQHARHAFLQQPLLFAQFEIHRSPKSQSPNHKPKIALAMMFFWISFDPP